jgi:hypothetical protein
MKALGSDCYSHQAICQISNIILLDNPLIKSSRNSLDSFTININSIMFHSVLRSGTQRLAIRKFATTAAMPKPPVPKGYPVYSFKEKFMSESGTYPLIVVMSCATCLVIGMSANALFRYKDLRISSKTRQQTIQTWGTEHYDTVVKMVATSPIAALDTQMVKARHEGLGVDHEAFVKAQQERKRKIQEELDEYYRTTNKTSGL